MEAGLRKSLFAVAAAALALAGCGSEDGGGAGTARQQIRIVGSSTVYPFTRAVAERFGRANPAYGAPVVESTGTGGGIADFCAGVGAERPDIANASRRMKSGELETCLRNGVNQVIEVPVGIDGLTLIESAERPTGFRLTARDVYAALAADPFGRPQTARTWRDVNSALPAVAIRVYGPPPTSGTRDSFAELILEKGCNSDPAMEQLKAQDSDRHKQVCTRVREDGAFVEAGEDDNLLVQRVSQNEGSVGVLGYSFLQANGERVRGIPIGGVMPTAATISDLSYPGARQLYIYVKGEHLAVIPGIREFLAEYANGWAPGGYLSQIGMIPSAPDVQARAAAAIANPRPLTAADLR
ncbi:substrate-binding domain-containing protein [Allosphingosinicella sp.]|jgi:phosphate transport system substrate-binding protein|uniref:substrate-binding domain-containing protein n=1 Tax=Allosphingosinicella sp. TaxID=2823234 RepID=UPI002EF6BD14